MQYNHALDELRTRTTEELEHLTKLQHAPVEEHAALFRRKLELCTVRFSFLDINSHARGKELKRGALLELVDYIHSDEGQQVLAVEGMIKAAMLMVSGNIFRSPPPVDNNYDVEEDDPVFEPSWPHLQVVYEFLLRVVVSRRVVVKEAKREGGVDQAMCAKLVRLFDSCDPRERDYLKTILHRIYGKFMSHRSFIRKQIANVFLRFAHETHRHNGIAELLEIFGSIINGFALPLKPEHQTFLTTVLLPLHKPRCVGLYHQQLSYCISQYIEKDQRMIGPILHALFRYWPWANSSKQILFLNELEEVLEFLNPVQYDEHRALLIKVLARCVRCEHFQVVERALFLWNNEHLLTNFLAKAEAHHVLPAMFDSLDYNANRHWNPTVRTVAQAIASLYQSENPELWERVKDQSEKDRVAREARAAETEKLWAAIESA